MRSMKTLLTLGVAAAVIASPTQALAQSAQHPITSTYSNNVCSINVHKENEKAAHWFGYDMAVDQFVFRKIALENSDFRAFVQTYKDAPAQSEAAVKAYDGIKNILRTNYGFEDNDMVSAIHIIQGNFDYVLNGTGDIAGGITTPVSFSPEQAKQALAADNFLQRFTKHTPVNPADVQSSAFSEGYNALREQRAAERNEFLQTLKTEASAALRACAEMKNYPESAPHDREKPQAPEKKGGLGVGAIIGIVAGVLAAIAGLIALTFPLLKPTLDRLIRF